MGDTNGNVRAYQTPFSYPWPDSSMAAYTNDLTDKTLNYANSGIFASYSNNYGGYSNGYENYYNGYGNGATANDQLYEQRNSQVQTILNDPNMSKDVEEMAENIHDSFNTIMPNDVSTLKEEFEKMKENPALSAAVELKYGEEFGNGSSDQLRKDLKSNFGTIGDKYTNLHLGSIKNVIPVLAGAGGLFALFKKSSNPVVKTVGLVASLLGFGLAGAKVAINQEGFNLDDAMSTLNKGAQADPRVAAIALNNAVSGLGTDKQTEKDIICNNSSNEFLANTKSAYESMYGESLEHDIKKEWGWQLDHWTGNDEIAPKLGEGSYTSQYLNNGYGY